jgi:LruC domain-containing protein
MMKAVVFFGFVLLALLISGCTPKVDEPTTDVSKMTLSNIVVPDNFDYATSRNVEITLNVPEVLNGAVFQLHTLKNGNADQNFGKGTFDASGYYTGLYPINTNIDSIKILSNYLGLTDQVNVPIVGNKAIFDYRPLYDTTKIANWSAQNMLKSATAGPFTYLSSAFNSNGIPNNLIKADVFAKNFYDDINASLPEYIPITKSHPEYLAGKESNLVLTKTAQVWMTFVTEGAGWRNALGFYTDPNKELKIVFPNASLPGAGGALAAGSKVYLGQFPAGTTIGWFLVANGWNGTSVVAGNGTRFSDPSLNTETNPNLKQHVVLLYDKARFLTLIGFEDMGRESGADNDFNDAVFYATTNPVDAVSTTNLAAITAAVDSDGDGINDAIDDFPFDPNKAFNNYMPSIASNGSLAFEDLWPSKGDYDFNDLVVDYNFNQIANAQNNITTLNATFTIANVGGSYKNGFAFSLPISPSKIKSIKNQVLNSNYTTFSANGTEAGQSQSVIFAIGNAQVKKGTKIPLVIEFNTPVSTSELGSKGGAPYNPFIVVNGDRSREVHLPDMPPTNKGGSSLGQGDDYSNAATGRYYKSNRNLPWALNIFSSFSPPAEKVSIDKTYSRFISWANSGGTKDLDWYK